MAFRLNEKQAEAVNSKAKKILCLAGAGTGKTRTLVARISRVYKDRVGASSITALTFTRMAGQEIKKRVAEEVGPAGKHIFCNTFHAFALKVITDYGYLVGIKAGFTIYDDLDRDAIFKRIISDYRLDATAKKSIGIYTGQGNGAAPVFSTNPRKNELKRRDHERLLAEYERRLLQNNAVDLSRLIPFTNEILKVDIARQEIKKGCKYLFVDEYQDTNDEQAKMIRLLDPEHLFIVGDDYQSIYEWRGAIPQNIIDLSKSPEWITIRLEKNYRSTGRIINLANGIIAKNQNRTEKSLIPVIPGSGKVQLATFQDEIRQVEDIVKIIQEAPSKPLAVLCRTNKVVSTIGRELNTRGVPAAIISSMYDPMRRPYVRSIVQVLQLAINPNDNHALKNTIFAFGPKYIKLDDFERAKHMAQILDTSIIEELRKSEKAEDFLQMIDYLHEEKYVAADAMNYVIEYTGVTEFYKQIGLDNRNEDIWNAMYKINKWESRQIEAGDGVGIAEFCQWIMIKDIQAGLIEAEEQPVKVMTIHAAKGLEFDRVYLPNMNTDTFPSARSFLEEERRLFFVALTRAERELYLSATFEETVYTSSKRTMPSLFFNDAKEINKLFAIDKPREYTEDVM